jgi:hypothetical protein
MILALENLLIVSRDGSIVLIKFSLEGNKSTSGKRDFLIISFVELAFPLSMPNPVGKD